MRKGGARARLLAHQLTQEIEVLRLAEEVGLVGRQQIDHLLQLLGLVARCEQPVILTVAGEAVVVESAAEAADEQHALGIGKADAGEPVDQSLEEGELVVGDGWSGRVHVRSEEFDVGLLRRHDERAGVRLLGFDDALAGLAAFAEHVAGLRIEDDLA
jgi:hypothetical protein